VVSISNAMIGLNRFFGAGQHISRSVNFEPLHYLAENPLQWKRPFVFALKIYSTFLERISSDILAISPRDLKSYALFPSLRKLDLLPLCQLPSVLEKPTYMAINDHPVQLGFMGSTFNVAHNEYCLRYILETLAPAIHTEFGASVKINIFGVKAKFNQLPENVHIHGWVEDLESIFIDNQVFLVPYFGGMGQQSKLFEPLARGKLVIANGRALAGYNFSPAIHFLEFNSVTDVLNIIRSILETRQLIITVGDAARIRSKELFSTEYYLNLISKYLQG
jgi:hypothetical protein